MVELIDRRWILPPDRAARAVRLYAAGCGVLLIAVKVGCTPRLVVAALEAAGVEFRTPRTWDPWARKWILHRTPASAVAAELAAWRRYVAYVEVMANRHSKSRVPWPGDAKARHIATLWLATRAKRPRRKPQPADQRAREFFRKYDRERQASRAVRNITSPHQTI